MTRYQLVGGEVVHAEIPGEADGGGALRGGGGVLAGVVVAVSWALVTLTLPWSLCVCWRVVPQYERAVVFRLGRSVPEARGPGLVFALPCTDTVQRVDLRTTAFCIPPQEVLTKDTVPVGVDVVVYYRVYSALLAVLNVVDPATCTQRLAQSVLRAALGARTLAEVVAQKDGVGGVLREKLDEAAAVWGVNVERVDIRAMRLPQRLQRAMAREAEAQRAAAANLMRSRGEALAARPLTDAAATLAASPCALHLRYLRTATALAANNQSTILYPVPIGGMAGLRGVAQ